MIKMEYNEQHEKTLDNIKMSDQQREAIKKNKQGFIKQTRMMFKLYQKLCKKCKTNIIKGVQSGELNKVSGEEFKEMMCNRCKPVYDKVVK